MAILPKERVKSIVIECLKGMGHPSEDGSFDSTILEEIHKSNFVNCVINNFKKLGAETILSEPELDNFHSIDEIVEWCWEHQE